MSDQSISGISASQLRQAADIQDRIENLYQELERVLSGEAVPKRRGRPVGSGATEAKPTAKRKGGARKMSAEGRARIVAAQKKRWAAIKKLKKKA